MISADAWRRTSPGTTSGQESEALDRITALYEVEHPRLCRFIASRIHDDAVAEELAQEAFLRLVRASASGAMPDDPPAWLFRVALNLAMSHGRHLSVARRSRVEPPPDGPAPPEHAVLEAERSQAIGRCMKTLAPDARRAVALAAEGYRGPEIALAIGRSQLATRALLCRSRMRLRMMLAEQPLQTG